MIPLRPRYVDRGFEAFTYKVSSVGNRSKLVNNIYFVSEVL